MTSGTSFAMGATLAARAHRKAARRWAVCSCLGLAATLLLAATGYLERASALPPRAPDPRGQVDRTGYDARERALAALRGLGPTPAFDLPLTADPETLRAALAPRQTALDTLRRAMRLPYEVPRLSLDTLLPNLWVNRVAARGFCAEAIVARAEGHAALSMQRSLDAIDLGASVGRGGTYIFSRLGAGCIDVGLESAERSLAGLPVTEVRSAGERLDRIENELPDLRSVFEQERRLRLEVIRASHEDGPVTDLFRNVGVAHNWPDRGKAVATALHPLAFTYGAIDHYFRTTIRELGKPAALRRLPALPPEASDCDLSPDDPPSVAELDRARLAVRLLRLELALQEYAAAHGAYPLSLDALPGLSRAARSDPYDGRPLRYRRTGDTYLLYSVGPDGVDDGGRAIRDREFSSVAKGDLVAGRLYSHPISLPAAVRPKE